jgi:hypothetical protein
MSSIFSYEYKGLIYLVGLLLTTAIAIGLSKNSIFDLPNVGATVAAAAGLPTTSTTSTASVGSSNNIAKTIVICNSLALGSNGPLSNIPLSILVSTYTFAYLLYFIYLANSWAQNAFTYIIFAILIFAQMYWSSSNSCSNPASILASVLIGASGGILWGLSINNMGLSQIGYYNGLGNQNVCSIPKKQTFKCTQRRVTSSS